MTLPPRAISPAPVRAVIFDMDGVVFEGHNFWLDLHTRFGGDADEARELLDRYLENDYATLAEEIVGRLWKGKPAAPYLSMVEERRYQPGVEETFGRLRDLGVATALVTSGPDLLALRAQRDLGIATIRANGLEVANGVLTGRAKIGVPDGEKGRVVLEVMRELGVEPAEAAAVGDSSSDVQMVEQVGVPIAYDSRSERLSAIARHRLSHGELPRLPEIVHSAPQAA